MQTATTIIFISAALLYLCIKWMPMAGKKMLTEWLARKAPALLNLLPASVKNCSSGCSSCGGCSDGKEGKLLAKRRQHETIIPIRRL
ncbi:hypothetical protein BH11PSE12_BH11PSE12_17170 [soil metagenome]